MIRLRAMSFFRKPKDGSRLRAEPCNQKEGPVVRIPRRSRMNEETTLENVEGSSTTKVEVVFDQPHELLPTSVVMGSKGNHAALSAAWLLRRRATKPRVPSGPSNKRVHRLPATRLRNSAAHRLNSGHLRSALRISAPDGPRPNSEWLLDKSER
jgi:hypothetical protein